MNDQALDTAAGAEDRSQQRRRRSGPEWRRLIAQQEAGDVSVGAFCDEHGLTVSSFHAWRRRFRRAAGIGGDGFVEVRARADGSSDGLESSGGLFEVRMGPATLLAPLTSLPDVIAALSREMQRRC
jgi:transposase-like protein